MSSDLWRCYNFIPETPGLCWMTLNCTLLRFRRVLYLNAFASFLWWTQVTLREDNGKRKPKDSAPGGCAVLLSACSSEETWGRVGISDCRWWLTLLLIWSSGFNCLNATCLNYFIKLSLWCWEVIPVKRQNRVIMVTWLHIEASFPFF